MAISFGDDPLLVMTAGKQIAGGPRSTTMLEASEENRLMSSSESIPAYRFRRTLKSPSKARSCRMSRSEAPTASGPVITRAASGRSRF